MGLLSIGLSIAIRGAVFSHNPQLSPGQQWAQKVLQGLDWIKTPKHIYAVLKPVDLAPAGVFRYECSYDERYVAFISEVTASPNIAEAKDLDQVLQLGQAQGSTPPDSPTQTISVWDRSTGSITQILSTTSPSTSIETFNWVGKADELVATTRTDSLADASTAQSQTQFILYHMSSRKWVELGTFDSLNGEASLGDPTADGDKFLLTYQGKGKSTSVVINQSGAIVKTLPNNGVWLWGADGESLYMESFKRVGKKVVREYFRLGSNGALEQTPTLNPRLDQDEYDFTPDPNDALEIQGAAVTGAIGKIKMKTSGFILDSTVKTIKSRVKVGFAERAGLTRRMKTILFLDRGRLFARPIVQLPDSLLDALVAAAKAKALSEAKQIGLGIIMYSNDMDDAFPDASNFSDQIDPYVKNQDMVDDFVFVPPGVGKETDVASPAETIMGYVEGPGGRAVVYTDGHAKWQPDP